jgi:hypothetical protein
MVEDAEEAATEIVAVDLEEDLEENNTLISVNIK